MSIPRIPIGPVRSLPVFPARPDETGRLLLEVLVGLKAIREELRRRNETTTWVVDQMHTLTAPASTAAPLLIAAAQEQPVRVTLSNPSGGVMTAVRHTSDIHEDGSRGNAYFLSAGERRSFVLDQRASLYVRSLAAATDLSVLTEVPYAG